MAKAVRKPRVKKDCPPVPVGVVPYLEYWKAAAQAGAERVGIPTTIEGANYALKQQQYWFNVASGLQWVIGHSKVKIRAIRKRVG